VVRWPFLLEGRRPILEELLLTAVEDRGLQTQFIAELEIGSFSSRCRLRMAIFSSGVWCFRCLFMRSLHYRTGRTPSPFPAEPEHRVSSFSALTSSSRAASNSSRVPVLCFVIALVSLLEIGVYPASQSLAGRRAVRLLGTQIPSTD